MKTTKKGSEMELGAMKHKDTIAKERKFDLRDQKGERVRIHISTEGEYTKEIRPRQELLICELDVPPVEFEHAQKIVNGETIIESKEKELKLEKTTMIEYLKKRGDQEII